MHTAGAVADPSAQVEVMHMLHKADLDTQLVQGLVLDHGARHPDMPTRLENCFILTCNVSLEWERSEVNSGFYYSDADQRGKLVAAERQFTDDRLQQVIDLKRKVCPEGEPLPTHTARKKRCLVSRAALRELRAAHPPSRRGCTAVTTNQ